jgi:hypothetical protein
VHRILLAFLWLAAWRPVAFAAPKRGGLRNDPRITFIVLCSAIRVPCSLIFVFCSVIRLSMTFSQKSFEPRAIVLLIVTARSGKTRERRERGTGQKSRTREESKQEMSCSSSLIYLYIYTFVNNK